MDFGSTLTFFFFHPCDGVDVDERHDGQNHYMSHPSSENLRSPSCVLGILESIRLLGRTGVTNYSQSSRCGISTCYDPKIQTCCDESDRIQRFELDGSVLSGVLDTGVFGLVDHRGQDQTLRGQTLVG